MKVLYGLIENTDVVKKMDHSSGFKKLSDYTEEEVEFRLENYYKFMFVRSPSERVVSAYRNKFNEIEAFYKVYGKRIMDKFHPERSNVSVSWTGWKVILEILRLFNEHSFTKKCNEKNSSFVWVFLFWVHGFSFAFWFWDLIAKSFQLSESYF